MHAYVPSERISSGLVGGILESLPGERPGESVTIALIWEKLTSAQVAGLFSFLNFAEKNRNFSHLTFERTYRDLAQFLAPVTVRTLRATSDEYGKQPPPQTQDERDLDDADPDVGKNLSCHQLRGADRRIDQQL